MFLAFSSIATCFHRSPVFISIPAIFAKRNHFHLRDLSDFACLSPEAVVCRCSTTDTYFVKFTIKHVCRGLFFIKLQNSNLQLYQKGDSRTGCFRVNFSKNLRAIFCRTPANDWIYLSQTSFNEENWLEGLQKFWQQFALNIRFIAVWDKLKFCFLFVLNRPFKKKFVLVCTDAQLKGDCFEFNAPGNFRKRNMKGWINKIKSMYISGM